MDRLSELRFSAGLIWLGAVLLLQSGCGDFTYPPEIQSVSPSPLLRGQQNVQVTITGAHFLSANGSTPDVFLDDGEPDGITGSVVSFDYTHIVVNLSVSNTAALGSHRLAVYTFSTGPDSTNIGVLCDPPASCTPPPTLEDVSNEILQGQSKIVTFRGRNLLNNSPALDVDPNIPDLTFGAPGPVYQSDNLDAFDVIVTAGPDAHTGARSVRVVTTGGRSAWRGFGVAWRSINVVPPASEILLDDVTPSHVAPGGDVLIECHGKGFGTSREVQLTPQTPPGNPTPSPIPTTTLDPVNGEADWDSVAVARIHPDPSFVGIVKVRVKNLETGFRTRDFKIFVDSPEPGAPVATNNAIDGVPHGGTYTLHATGQNLSDVTNASWSGVPGLTFSNTNPTATTVSVDVTADMTAPLTGNKATNLTINHGRSFPIPINVLPPPPPP